MGLLVFVAKILLTILNAVFAMLALIMVLVGCALFYAGDFIIPFTNLLLQQLAARGAISQASLTVEGFDIAGIAAQIAWPMVMCGAVLFCISFLGCCGANCENKLLLILYAVVMTVILAGEILAVVVLAGGQEEWKNRAITEANNFVINEYKGDNSSDAFSVLLNVAQMGLQCCGINTYETLQTATNWVRTGTFGDQSGNTITGTMLIPFSCCKMEQPFPSVTPTDVNCVLTLSDSTSYYNTACFDKVIFYVNAYSYWAIIGTLAFFGTELAIIILTILIIRSIGKPINPLI